MAGDSKKVQPIIIKRVKKGGHAAHGGAWKIAYADFVTAMMAFFLLMWLLGSTTEGDRKGIADYFNSPLKVAFFGGSGAGDATSLVKGGGNSLSESAGQVKKGASEQAEIKARKKALQAQLAAAEAARLKVVKEKVEEVIANDSRLAQYKQQIRLDITAEEILAERGQIEVGCDFCGHQYRFDAVDAARLFTSPGDQPPVTSAVQ